jgi:hypothetical protein
VRKQSSIFKLTFLFSVPLLIMVALAAGIKEFYWIAIVFMEVCFLYIIVMFVSTFFSRDTLKLRKSLYKKNDMN